MMGLIEFALIASAIVALYNVQQIKMTLKEKGYPVELATGWLRDYRQYKELIADQESAEDKAKYQKILNGLHFSLMGLVLFGFLLLRNHL
jgi:hypothetical protein